MGLDNIPNQYACKKQDVAVMSEDGRIDCSATIKSGKCPHNNMKNNDPLIKDTIIPLGMLGTNCWYRGKYGAYLLEQMKNHIKDFSYDVNTLYGNELEDGNSGLSADECLSISKEMIEYSEAWVHYVKTNSEVAGNLNKEKDLIDDWSYLAWWLKFVGQECDGSISWY